MKRPPVLAIAIGAMLVLMGVALVGGLVVYLRSKGDPNTPKLKSDPAYGLTFPHGTLEHVSESNPIGGADARRVRYYATAATDREIAAYYESTLTAHGYLPEQLTSGPQQASGRRVLLASYRRGDIRCRVFIEPPPVAVTTYKSISAPRVVVIEELQTTRS